MDLEEEEDEVPAPANGTNGHQESLDDMDVDGHDLSGANESFNSLAAATSTQGTPSRSGTAAPRILGAVDPSTPAPATPAAPAQPRRKMKITHDKFVEIQTLVVLHLAEVERSTGAGLDRDALIDWYLEKNEQKLTTMEELEYEQRLFEKVLKRLVQVGIPFAWFNQRNNVRLRTTISSKSDRIRSLHCHLQTRIKAESKVTLPTWFIHQLMRRIPQWLKSPKTSDDI